MAAIHPRSHSTSPLAEMLLKVVGEIFNEVKRKIRGKIYQMKFVSPRCVVEGCRKLQKMGIFAWFVVQAPYAWAIIGPCRTKQAPCASAINLTPSWGEVR
jgi:hypothetical protein